MRREELDRPWFGVDAPDGSRLEDADEPDAQKVRGASENGF